MSAACGLIVKYLSGWVCGFYIILVTSERRKHRCRGVEIHFDWYERYSRNHRCIYLLFGKLDVFAGRPNAK